MPTDLRTGLDVLYLPATDETQMLTKKNPIPDRSTSVKICVSSVPGPDSFSLSAGLWRRRRAQAIRRVEFRLDQADRIARCEFTKLAICVLYSSVGTSTESMTW